MPTHDASLKRAVSNGHQGVQQHMMYENGTKTHDVSATSKRNHEISCIPYDSSSHCWLGGSGAGSSNCPAPSISIIKVAEVLAFRIFFMIRSTKLVLIPT